MILYVYLIILFIIHIPANLCECQLLERSSTWTPTHVSCPHQCDGKGWEEEEKDDNYEMPFFAFQDLWPSPRLSSTFLTCVLKSPLWGGRGGYYRMFWHFVTSFSQFSFGCFYNREHIDRATLCSTTFIWHYDVNIFDHVWEFDIIEVSVFLCTFKINRKKYEIWLHNHNHNVHNQEKIPMILVSNISSSSK